MHWSQISDRAAGDVVILDVRGHMTLSDEETSLFRYVCWLTEAGARRFVLNLRHVEFIDSVGIGEIVRCYMHVAEQGGSLKLCAVGPRIRDVLVATSLNTVIKMFETEAEALRSF